MALWTQYPNWAGGYRETYAFMTEILVSRAGREQRRALRITPRVGISYQVSAARTRQLALRRAMARQHEVWTLPDEVRSVLTMAAVTFSSTTATLASMPQWVAAGLSVVFEDPLSRERRARTVQSVAGTVATFTAQAGRAWEAGTIVRPLYTGRFPESLSGRHLTNMVDEMGIEFEVEPGSLPEPTTSPTVTFSGVEVFTHLPNWSERIDVTHMSPRETVDNETGVRSTYRPIPFNTEIRKEMHVIRTTADLDATLGLFRRAKGRRGEFYVPSRIPDFRPMADIAAGANLIRIAGTDFADAYMGDTVHRAIAIARTDGEVLRHRVESITRTTTESHITIEGTFAQALPVASFDEASWLILSRFASDEMTVEWLTDTTARVIVNIQSLEDLT